MKVEIWSEVACPWCGLGSHRVERAVERFGHGEHVEVVHRSFPLGSDLPEGSVFTVRDILRSRYGMSGDQAEVSARRIEALAESEGLSPYRVLDNTAGNTDLAHEFLAHASAEGKNRAAWKAIFRAYFGRAEPVFSLEDLLKLAGELGLDRERTRRALTGRSLRQQVLHDARQAQRLGASGAPFIVVDGRYGVAGAQDSDSLLQLLRTAWDETHPVTLAPGGHAPACGPGGCAVPAATS
ncbi:DsbA family oxidoreductase [Nonomuraea rubra]|uniref:DsbA family oxidoreductase n=1 Tax=Nonomuraea rubra TaxID=46180 RepID=UPI003411F0A6